MAELNGGLRRKNAQAKELIQASCRSVCPEELGSLKRSIDGHSDASTVIVGTNKWYGGFVHNGTYDFRHSGPWTEGESAEILAWQTAQRRRGGSTQVTPPKGLMPRPFMVYGMVLAKPGLIKIYGAPIGRVR
jgi:phage gpG-like protein